MRHFIPADCRSLDEHNNCRHPNHQRAPFSLSRLMLGRREECVFSLAVKHYATGCVGVVCSDQVRHGDDTVVPLNGPAR